MSAHETTAKINGLLRDRYTKHGIGRGAKWVLIDEAPNAGDNRYCDLIAMGVWHGTSNRILGHEVKASRSDWLKEVDSPEKSDAFIPYCSEWYIVAASGVVKLEELRASWGLMEMSKSGTSLKIRKQAEKSKDVKPLPPRMVATWMRRVVEAASQDKEIAARIKEAIEQDRKSRQWQQDYQGRRLEIENKQMREAINTFREQSGVSIENRWDLGNISKAVAMIVENDRERVCRDYLRIHDQLSTMMARSKEVAVELAKIQETTKAPNATNN